MSQKCKRCGIMMVPRGGDNCSLCEAEIRRGASAQPMPIRNDLPAVWPLVIADMQARDALGRARYGTPLQPANGRNALLDAYEEQLDGIAYTKQLLIEQEMLRRLLTDALDAIKRDSIYTAAGFLRRALELLPAGRDGR